MRREAAAAVTASKPESALLWKRCGTWYWCVGVRVFLWWDERCDGFINVCDGAIRRAHQVEIGRFFDWMRESDRSADKTFFDCVTSPVGSSAKKKQKNGCVRSPFRTLVEKGFASDGSDCVSTGPSYQYTLHCFFFLPLVIPLGRWIPKKRQTKNKCGPLPLLFSQKSHYRVRGHRTGSSHCCGEEDIAL